MPFECPQDVANDYERILNSNEEEYDVFIYAGNDNRKIYAHSFVLRTRSQHFRTAFSMKSLDKKDGKFIFNIPNISYHFFYMILRFIYCGKIDLDQLGEPDILKLLIAVDEINIKILTNYIQEYLIKNKDGYLQQNSTEILEMIYQNNSFTNLRNICIKKICDVPERLLNSNKFISLEAPLLELLFQRDDLPLDEIVIWDNLIRWCLAQHNSNVSKVPSQWGNNETTIMGRTIHRFIPLIRFCHISPKDFAAKVFPFKEIIPSNLVNNMVQFHMTQDQKLNNDTRSPRQSSCNIDSVIISQNHMVVFTNWIYRKDDKYYGYIPYKFNLLYRASRDGNTTEAFHAKCDSKGATLVVIKMKNSNQIAGGYNPFSWDTTSYWRPTNDSFIFLSTDRNNLQSAKICYGHGDAKSIGCFSDKGPTFGWNLNVYKGTWYCDRTKAYDNIGLPKWFYDDDYEVFQVIKK
ncbi:hypothetical protein RclHR1_11970005 [Rhizophagus clarus]|uniref:BTB domain-containing protein n=1 Tax=Rhizophagus clarus TaxID=94130 RepID=A0A2Z6QI21_9GLOM|nr:hypothetical protein RclHR1_11970005 [Rhizophagus clarus]GES85019.1 hypothetical protein GLOIN_2v1769254 [Rhizophagus clarus]